MQLCYGQQAGVQDGRLSESRVLGKGGGRGPINIFTTAGGRVR